MPWKFSDGSGAIMLINIRTDIQTKSQTYITDNNTPSLGYAARVVFRQTHETVLTNKVENILKSQK